MALNINEQTSSMADFVSKLYTFLTTSGAGNPGWTADRHVPASGEMAVSKAALGTNTNDIQVAFQWDTTSPQYLGVYQYNHASGAGNYNTGAAPYAQSNDSGNGAASTSDANLGNSRRLVVTDSPVQYWAFVTTTPVEAVYVVVEYTSGYFSHMSFGEVIKFNDWDGGAFCCGHRYQGVFNNNQTVQPGSTMLFDALAANGSNPNPTIMYGYTATINIENLPSQQTSGMWGTFGNFTAASVGNDRQSTPRARDVLYGGYRGGEIGGSYGQLVASPTAGFVPGYPIAFVYAPSGGQVYGPMGVMPNVCGINIANFAAGDEITDGSSTWAVFPNRHRTDNSGEVGASHYQGVAYLKNS